MLVLSVGAVWSVSFLCNVWLKSAISTLFVLFFFLFFSLVRLRRFLAELLVYFRMFLIWRR